MRAVSPDDDDRRQQRRQEILESAKQVFAASGFHTASISDIIHRASIARGTFYLYFDSKQAVFDSILDAALAELRARITRIEVGAGAESPQLQLRQNLVRVLDYVLDDRPLTMILLNHKQSPSVEVAQRIDGFFRGVSLLIKSSLDYGISMKLVRPCNTSLVAPALLGAVRGVIEHCLHDIEAPDIEAPDTDTIVDELIAFVLHGVFIG
jgi:AcrR family transcriptional regulator